MGSADGAAAGEGQACPQSLLELLNNEPQVEISRRSSGFFSFHFHRSPSALNMETIWQTGPIPAKKFLLDEIPVAIMEAARASSEGVHFLLQTNSPSSLGRKSRV